MFEALFVSLRSLHVRLKFSSKIIAFHSALILSRYVRFVSDSVVSETTRFLVHEIYLILKFHLVFFVDAYCSVLAAVVLLSLKAAGMSVKHKLRKRIVHSSYCQVFHRNEEDVPLSSVESLILR